jgi:hypothetical protein
MGRVSDGFAYAVERSPNARGVYARLESLLGRIDELFPFIILVRKSEKIYEKKSLEGAYNVSNEESL